MFFFFFFFQTTFLLTPPQHQQTGLGDRRSYQLSTIRNEMGVVYANSLAGHQLIPLNDEEMQCTGTGQIEQRKVALGGQDFWWI